MPVFSRLAAGGILLLAHSSHALNVDISNVQSVEAAAKTIAQNVMKLYSTSLSQSQIPGLFGSDYYWGECGMAWDSMIQYWAKTGDATYNNDVAQAIAWQVGPDKDFMPPNQTQSEGNDDQSLWALAAMTAAETNFQAPPSSSGVKSWLQLAEAVFNDQVARWDTTGCDKGGLRWQIFAFNAGYDYQDSLSNGNFVQLAARLAQYTGNKTYVQWAQRAAEWSTATGLLSSSGEVYAGLDITSCDITKLLWTSDAGTYLNAYVYMSNYTNKGEWTSLTPKIFESIDKSFATTPKDGVLTETSCDQSNNCPTFALAYRAILARALGNMVTMDASTDASQIPAVKDILRLSGEGAAAQCSGGSDGTTCGSDWSTGQWDGTKGLGQDLSALEILLANIPATGQQKSSTTTTTGDSSGTTGQNSGTPSGTSSATSSPTGKNGSSRLSGSLVGPVVALGLVVAYCF